MKLLLGLVGALAVLLVGGCSAPAPAAAPAPPEKPPVPVVADPVSVSIPKLAASSELMKLGRDAAGALQVPPIEHPEVAGWFAGDKLDEDGDETKPGQRGSAVIAAHVDGLSPTGENGHPGLFKKLGTLVPGDEVLVEQQGGTTLRFVIESVETFSKAAFPGQRVYLADDGIRLNLVTCGGAFDEASGHYVDNIVAFAKLAP